MELKMTINQKTGNARYYIDGVRVSRIAYHRITIGDYRIECFCTIIHNHLTRHFCNATKRQE